MRKSASPRVARTAAAGSWLAILAATTLGDGASTVRAEVRADGPVADGVYRLVVQSYDSGRGTVPDQSARPLGSAQRAVTADELRHGVQVNLVEFGRTESGEAARVVAWIEAGAPNLEFDGRTSRPGPGSVFGSAKRQGPDVQISLTRKLQA